MTEKYTKTQCIVLDFEATLFLQSHTCSISKHEWYTAC